MVKNSEGAKKVAVELWRRLPDSSSEDEDKKKEDKDKDEDDDTDKKKKKGKVGIIQDLFYIFFRCADVEDSILLRWASDVFSNVLENTQFEFM